LLLKDTAGGTAGSCMNLRHTEQLLVRLSRRTTS
jgi:hypothetical protein